MAENIESGTAEGTAEQTSPSKFASRKFTLGMVGIGSILLVIIIAGLLKKFCGMDIAQYLGWAIPSIAGLCGISSGAIAWEDVAKTKAAGPKTYAEDQS